MFGLARRARLPSVPAASAIVTAAARHVAPVRSGRSCGHAGRASSATAAGDQRDRGKHLRFADAPAERLRQRAARRVPRSSRRRARSPGTRPARSSRIRACRAGADRARACARRPCPRRQRARAPVPCSCGDERACVCVRARCPPFFSRSFSAAHWSASWSQPSRATSTPRGQTLFVALLCTRPITVHARATAAVLSTGAGLTIA